MRRAHRRSGMRGGTSFTAILLCSRRQALGKHRRSASDRSAKLSVIRASQRVCHYFRADSLFGCIFNLMHEQTHSLKTLCIRSAPTLAPASTPRGRNFFSLKKGEGSLCCMHRGTRHRGFRTEASGPWGHARWP